MVKIIRETYNWVTCFLLRCSSRFTVGFIKQIISSDTSNILNTEHAGYRTPCLRFALVSRSDAGKHNRTISIQLLTHSSLPILTVYNFGRLIIMDNVKYLKKGRAVVKAVSRWLPTAAVRVRIRGLWWRKWQWGRFSPSTSVSSANHHSTNFSIIIITRDWHNRPIGGRSAE
jgi:hypothetical protein